MSYFVTLPSNGADLKTEEDLQNNTQTDFVIKLNRTLNFFQQTICKLEPKDSCKMVVVQVLVN